MIENIGKSTTILSLLAFYLLVGLLTFVSLVPYQYIQWENIELAGFHINLLRIFPLIMIGLITVLTAFDRSARDIWFRLRDLNGYLLLFALIGLMSCFSAVNFELSISRWGYYVLTGILLFYLVVGNIQNKKRLYILLFVLIILGVVVALYGIIEFLAKSNFLFGSVLSNNNFLYYKLRHGPIPLLSENRIVATIGHPVTLGFFLLPPCLFAITMTGIIKKPLFKVFLIISAIIIGCALVFTFSRGSWLAFIIALSIYLARQSKRFMVFVVSGTIVILSILLSLSEIRETIINRNPIRYWEDPISQNRVMSYLTVSKIFEDYPLTGVGIANFRIQRKQYDEFSTAIDGPDNSFLMSLAEVGLAGLIIHCLILWLLVKRGFNAFRKATDFKLHNLMWGSYCLFIGLVFNMFTFDVFHQPAPRIFFWTVAGLLVGISELIFKEEKWDTNIIPAHE